MSSEELNKIYKELSSIKKTLNNLNNDFNKLRDSSLQTACILQTAVEQLNKRGGIKSNKSTNASNNVVKKAINKSKKSVNIRVFFANLVKNDKNKVINWLKKKTKSDKEPIANKAKEALNLFNKIYEEHIKKWGGKKSDEEILKKTANEFYKQKLQTKLKSNIRLESMYSWISELRDKEKKDNDTRNVAEPK